MAQKTIAGKPLTAPLVSIGLMSGTSMDGIDVALLTTDGEAVVERGPAGSFDYEPAFRKKLAAALETARAIARRDERPNDLGQVERELTLRHAAGVRSFIETNSLAASQIDVIGFHGQTVLHRPQEALTVQLGDGQLLARETGIRTVFDLRANDMAHGGQGAPLVPVYHRALAANLPSAMRRLPVAFVNIGGIANITWVGADGALIAFDTGPGNALIDQWVTAHAGVPYDPQGAIAAEGRVLPALARRYLKHPFLEKKGPKSLDRNDFSPPSASEASLEDGARTLAHVTAGSIWKAGDLLPALPKLWVICGGGRKNRAIMSDLQRLAREAAGPAEAPAGVVTAEEAGFNGDAMEAEAWAYLAVRSLRRLELTFPATTGCSHAVSGGVVALPED